MEGDEKWNTEGVIFYKKCLSAKRGRIALVFRKAFIFKGIVFRLTDNSIRIIMAVLGSLRVEIW